MSSSQSDGRICGSVWPWRIRCGVGLELFPVGTFPGGFQVHDQGRHGSHDQQCAAAGDLADRGRFEDVDPFAAELQGAEVADLAAVLAARSFFDAPAHQQRRPFQGLLGFEAAEDGQRGGVVEQGGR